LDFDIRFQYWRREAGMGRGASDGEWVVTILDDSGWFSTRDISRFVFFILETPQEHLRTVNRP
jgi:hypothetical protein